MNLNIEPAIQLELLQIALLCGGLFAAYRVLLTLTFPLLSGALWQHMVGPFVEGHWNGFSQSEDISRPSYMPLEPGQAYVILLSLFPPPLDDVTHGIRDGLLLGVFAALLPELMTAGMLTVVLAIVLGKAVWKISRNHGAARTDQVFRSVKELLIYSGAVAALNTVGLS